MTGIALLPDLAQRRAIRKAAGLTLVQAAAILAVSPRTLLRWEWGDCEPRPANRVAYAEQLRRWGT